MSRLPQHRRLKRVAAILADTRGPKGTCYSGVIIMAHDWRLDPELSSASLKLLIWRCRTCGCLQIKKGGPDAASVYKLNPRRGNPFKTLHEEPECTVPVPTPEASTGRTSVSVPSSI